MEDYKPYDDMADWFGHTTVHPVGLAIVVILAIATILLPRRWAFAPMVVLACVVPTAQRVVIVDLDFDFPRLLIIAGVLRFAIRGEFRRLEWNLIDRFMLLYAAVAVLAYVLLHQEPGSLTYRLGWAFDAIGFYFVFRFIFAGHGDIKAVVQVFVVVAVPVSVVFAIEHATHRNFFSVFGGVPPVTWIRDGRLRCQGPFAHPIIAGCFWGSLLPMFLSTWFHGGKWRAWSVVGSASALVVILATNSSTSVMAVIFGTLAVLAFPLRKVMRSVRWAAFGLAVTLHMFMKAPVWHLLASLTVFDASTGWHRFFVIDQSVHHFGEWWLLGVLNTNSWNVWDITNEYVMVGIEAGFFGLLMFLMMIWNSFKRVGEQCRLLERNRPATRLTWSLGAALFVHCTNYIGVSYFGQAKMVWYLLLALIASLVPPAVGALRSARPPQRTGSSRAARRAARRAAKAPAAPGGGASPAAGGAAIP